MSRALAAPSVPWSVKLLPARTARDHFFLWHPLFEIQRYFLNLSQLVETALALGFELQQIRALVRLSLINKSDTIRGLTVTIGPLSNSTLQNKHITAWSTGCRLLGS